MREILSPTAIEEKAQEISKRIGLKVYPFSFLIDDTDQVVGYIQEPKRVVKMAALDEMIKSMTMAGEMILNTSLIKEDSDPRILSEKSEDDSIFISSCLHCVTFLKMYNDELKKK